MVTSDSAKGIHGKTQVPYRLGRGAGTVVAGLSLGNLDAKPAGDPLVPEAKASSKLVEVPGTSFEVDDGLTKIKITVTLGRFLISPTELTQHEFEWTMGYNPSFHKGPELPVENVSWWEAIRYCNLRSIKESLQPCYNLEDGWCDVRRTDIAYQLTASGLTRLVRCSRPAPAMFPQTWVLPTQRASINSFSNCRPHPQKPVGNC